jgi:ribokinase
MRSLTVGGATIDTIAIVESDLIERMTMSNVDSSFLLLKEGTKTEAAQISTHCGGGAINAAVALSRLGLETSALVKIGCDARGKTLRDSLKAENVSTRWVACDRRASTGASVIVSSHDQNAAIFTFRGTNTLLEVSDLEDDAFAVDLVYVSTLSNRSAECFPTIVAKAVRKGALISANPGPRQLAARGPAFEKCLANIDILSINRSEAELFLPSLVARFGEHGPTLDGDGLPVLAKRGLAGGGFQMSLRGFMSAISSLGPRYLLLTDGPSGAFVGTKKEIVYCPSLAVPVAGTAGAGDAFTSTFSGFISLGAGLDQALNAATVNAASVVGHIDTQSGLLKRTEIYARVARLQSVMRIRRWSI